MRICVPPKITSTYGVIVHENLGKVPEAAQVVVVQVLSAKALGNEVTGRLAGRVDPLRDFAPEVAIRVVKNVKNHFSGP